MYSSELLFMKKKSSGGKETVIFQTHAFVYKNDSDCIIYRNYISNFLSTQTSNPITYEITRNNYKLKYILITNFVHNKEITNSYIIQRKEIDIN